MNEYIPGECNIGAEEIARRRSVGWVSLAITTILLVAMLLTRVNRWWRVVLFFPAAMSASGFLQASFHFCSGFAQKGVFNFGPIGQTTSIEDEASGKKDKRKGFQVILLSVVLGATAAAVSELFH